MKKIIFVIFFIRAFNAQSQCDTVFSFPLLDKTAPSALTFDGTYFYTLGQSTPQIYKFDTTGQLRGTIPSPGTSLFKDGDLDFDGQNLWVVVEEDGIVYKLDTANGNVLAQFFLYSSKPGYKNNFGCAYDNGFIWSSQYTTDKSLVKIDAATGALIDSFGINRVMGPLKIIYNTLYGIEYKNCSNITLPSCIFQLDKFDKTTGTVTDSILWCIPKDGGFVYANNHLWGTSRGDVGIGRVYKFGTSPLCGMQSNIPRTTIDTTIQNGESLSVGIHTYDSTGIYRDTLAASNGCDSIITTNLTVLTGLKNLSLNSGIKIIPNPFTSSATIEILNSTFLPCDFIIYDILGQEKMRQKISNEKTEILRGNLKNALYFYQVKKNNQIISIGKLVME